MAWRPYRNFGLKLAALALGSLLWFTVTGERVERKIARVEIYYSNLPGSLVITDQPDSVDVTVRGTYADISRLQDLAITADLADATSGPNVVPLSGEQMTVPPGVEVVQIDPGFVVLYIEQSDFREVPIEPEVDGEPASGFVVKDVAAEPATVGIVGPQSRLNPTTVALTERISIAGESSTITRNVMVFMSDAQLRPAEPTETTVTVTIEPAPVTERFESVPVTFPNLGATLEVVGPLPTVVVTIRGTTDQLASLDAAAIMARIDLAGLGPGEYTRDVVVLPPPGLEIDSVVPASLTLRIR
jgi:YbbR domain-containing protein